MLSPVLTLLMFVLVLTLTSGADKTCDHWHGAAGFATAHMALTLMYEQALQAVNPSIAIPYWDFTLASTKNVFLGSTLPPNPLSGAVLATCGQPLLTFVIPTLSFSRVAAGACACPRRLEA